MKNIKSYNESLVDASNEKKLNNRLLNYIEKGNVNGVKSLLDMGIQVNGRHYRRMTPLHIAVFNENIEIIKLLIDRGAKVNLRNKDGNTALNISTLINTDIEIIKLLLNSAADPNIGDLAKNTPLHRATKPEIAEILIDSGASIDAKNSSGNTPLHNAVLRFFGVTTDSLNFIKTLIDSGADTNIKNNLGFTPPQMILNDTNKKEIIKFFISNGVDPLNIFEDVTQIINYFDGDIDWMPDSDTKRRLRSATRSKKMFGI